MASYKMVDGKLKWVSDTEDTTRNDLTKNKHGSLPGKNQGIVGGTTSKPSTTTRVPDSATIAEQKGKAEEARILKAEEGKGASDDGDDKGGEEKGGEQVYVPPVADVNPTLQTLASNVASSTPVLQQEKYTESQAVTDARNAYQNYTANGVDTWTGGTYGTALQNAMDAIQNREKFSYDLNGDMLYQQYKDKYINQGNLAMQDTIAQASAMTGGYGNSYATTAGNQAYQSYLQQLNDKIPELYQLAYDKYNQEGQDLYNQYGLLSDQYNNEYSRYRDTVNDYNTEANRLYNIYANEAQSDYDKFSDDRNYNLTAYQQQVAENQYAQEMALKQAQFEQDVKQAEADNAYKYASLQQSAANNTYSYQVDALTQQNSYLEAINAVGDGIKAVHAGRDGYTFMGTKYSKKEDAENALAKYLDSMNLSDSQINAIYDKLGL